MDFNQRYKQWMESGREAPPEKVWEGIQDELDVDKVWGRVEDSLNASKRNTPFMLRAIAASFLLLLISATTLYYFTLSDHIEPGRPQLSDRPGTLIPERIPESQPEHIPGSASPATLQLAEGDIIQQETVTAQTDDNREAGRIFAAAQDIPAMLQSKPGNVTNRSNGEKTIDNYLAARHEDDIPKRDTPGQRPAFFVGVNGQIGNTWMLNSKTLGGLSSNDITDTRTSYGGSYGIVAGGRLFPRLRVRAGLDLLAQNRQRYNEYIRGEYVSTEFQLDYSKLSILFSFTPWEHRPWIVHGGAYSAYIRDAEQQINGQAEKISGQYTNTDYGLVAGLGYLHPTEGPFEIHTGILANYGLKNVFAGNDYIPSSLNNTRLISFQLSISLHYHLNKP
ncbi:MAG: hypothetical protein ACLFN2_01725 [Bacteroidales bacterium]